MSAVNPTEVTVMRPGEGETVEIPGFGAVFKLPARDSASAVAIVEHPFDVGFITAPHRHSREDEYSFVLAGEIGFRSDDTEAVLKPGGYITKPRGQMHAMWNAGNVPGRVIEIIAPGAFANYFRELSELLAVCTNQPDGRILHELPEFGALADKYGLTYGSPDWLTDVVDRYGLKPPTH